MELLIPDFGLVIWTAVAFLLLLVLLKAFAWKPIVAALKDREHSISDSLAQAEKARKEVAEMTASNEAILIQAREERANIIKEANDAKNSIVAEAKNEATLAASKVLENAKIEIEAQKNAVMEELKNASAKLALEIAEKVLVSELSDKSAQEKLVSDLISKASLN
ncbi:MAG: F-type H+-transporting ATPase subunit b [Planctomycetota bacterium]|jgi:F-type H+-transporting ATPase subunit b